MYKFLIVILIVVPGIDSSLGLSYINSYEMTLLSHISIRPIPPSAFDFVGTMKMKSPEVNTCASLFPNIDGTCPYRVYV